MANLTRENKEQRVRIAPDIKALTGSALISNTCVCEVSRLLVERERSKLEYDLWHECHTDQLRVIDLFSLIEAVVLHEHLYTLPCTPSGDLAQLSLRNELIEAGVLNELDTRDDHVEIAGLVYHSLVDFVGEADINFDRAKATFVQEFLGAVGEPRKNKPKTETRGLYPPSPTRLVPLSRIAGRIAGEGASRSEAGEGSPLGLYDSHDDRSSDSYASYARLRDLQMHLMAKIEEEHSGDYEYNDVKNLASLLRDMYYIIASEKYGLPYWPQFNRISFCRRFPNYFDISFRTKLYQRVAEALKSSITEAFDDLNDQIAYIPPFSALVLERSSRPEDIASALLSVRDEYKKLRHGLTELEKTRRGATSIKQRKQLREKERLMLEGAAASFDRPKTIRLEGVIRYIPEVVKPITAPLDPTKYSADLLLKPIQWLAEWWRRRPISPVFDLAAKVEEIHEYGRLVNRVFGNRFYYAESWENVLSRVQ